MQATSSSYDLTPLSHPPMDAALSHQSETGWCADNVPDGQPVLSQGIRRAREPDAGEAALSEDIHDAAHGMEEDVLPLPRPRHRGAAVQALFCII